MGVLGSSFSFRVDGFDHMHPTLAGDDGSVWIRGPHERHGALVGFCDDRIGCRQEAEDRVENAVPLSFSSLQSHRGPATLLAGSRFLPVRASGGGRNRTYNEAFWIHPPGETGLARRDDGITLILIAESTKKVIKLAIHLGNPGSNESHSTGSGISPHL